MFSLKNELMEFDLTKLELAIDYDVHQVRRNE